MPPEVEPPAPDEAEASAAAEGAGEIDDDADATVDLVESAVDAPVPEAEGEAAPEPVSAPPDASWVMPEEGDVLGDLFTLQHQLPGPAEIGTCFRAVEKDSERQLVIRILPPALLRKLALAELEVAVEEATQLTGREIVRIHGIRPLGAGRYVISGHVRGQRLSDLADAKRQRGKPFTANGAYNIIAHVLTALKAAHKAGVLHGDLRPDNILIDAKGRVLVADFGIGSFLSELRVLAGKRTAFDPLEDDPDVRADLRAAALVFAEIFSGIPADAAPDVLPSTVAAVVKPYLATRAEDRPDDAEAMRRSLHRAVGRTKTDGLGIRRAVTPPPPPPQAIDGMPFDPKMHSAAMFQEALSKIGGRKGGDERWLARKDGLDFGPFSAEELVDRVRAGEFEERTEVQDLSTGKRGQLRKFQEFERPLGRFLTEKAAREHVDEANRSARINTAKKAGKGLFLTIAMSVAAVVGVISWAFWHAPFPKPIAYAEATLSLGNVLAKPKLESVEEAAQRLWKREGAKRKKARKRSGRKIVSSYGDSGGGVTSIDMSDEGAGGKRPFNQGAVDRGLAGAQGKFQSCVRKELKRNPRLGNIKLEFWVQPNGGSKGIQVTGKGTRLFGKCMVDTVRSLRFPAYSGFPRKVSQSFQVSR